MDFLADESFDCVITVYTLRNFPDLQDALAEMMRVLKPGGAAPVPAPPHPSPRVTLVLTANG